jgi:hypothetical protein
MSKGPSEVQETPQQRALADYAANKLADYKQRWLPLQRNLASQIEAVGQPGSAAERLATGKAATDTAIQFDKAEGAVGKSLSNAGALPGSSKANLAATAMSADAAKSTGLGTMIADQQVKDAYTQGLSALAATGQGRSAMVGNSLERQAVSSGRQAATDAQISAEEQMARGELVGRVAGYGLFAASQGPKVPQAAYGGASRTPLGLQADQFTTNPQAGY